MAKGQKPKTEEEIIQKTAEYAARKLNQKRKEGVMKIEKEIMCNAN